MEFSTVPTMKHRGGRPMRVRTVFRNIVHSELTAWRQDRRSGSECRYAYILHNSLRPPSRPTRSDHPRRPGVGRRRRRRPSTSSRRRARRRDASEPCTPTPRPRREGPPAAPTDTPASARLQSAQPNVSHPPV